jgi:hypothetical protein
VRIFDTLKDALTRRHLGDPPIALSDDGFCVGEKHVMWSDVTEIRAYKIDLVTTDELRLVFALGPDDWLEISEEQAGFEQVSLAMTSRFPSAAGWRSRVLKPAFATNETVIYAGV